MLRTAFLITPFSSDRSGEEPDVYNSVQEAIRKASDKADVQLIDPKEDRRSGVIMDHVRNHIANSDVVLAVITGNNPNVLYEAGIADAIAKRPPILVRAKAQKIEDIPFDVRHLRIITYSGKPNVDLLADEICESLKIALAEPGGEHTYDVLHAPPDLEPDIAVKRPQLQQEVDAFLEEEDRGYLVLEAQAGMGKTWFLAQLVGERNYPHYFCAPGSGSRPAQAVRKSIAAQLASDWGLGRVATSDDIDLRSFLVRVAKQREKLQRPEKIVIVIDALDELPAPEEQNVIGLPHRLPPSVYFIVSRRPGSSPLRSDPPPRRVVLQPGDDQNRQDIRRLIHRFVNKGRRAHAAPAGLDIAELGKIEELLLDKSQGLWIYLKHVLPFARRARLQSSNSGIAAGGPLVLLHGALAGSQARQGRELACTVFAAARRFSRSSRGDDCN